MNCCPAGSNSHRSQPTLQDPPLLDKLGIPRAGFRAFRNMHTSLLLQSGASPRVAQRQRRRSNATTTLEVYPHVVEDSHRQAVERAANSLNQLDRRWTERMGFTPGACAQSRSCYHTERPLQNQPSLRFFGCTPYRRGPQVGAGEADCDNHPEIMPSTHPPGESVHPTAPRS